VIFKRERQPFRILWKEKLNLFEPKQIFQASPLFVTIQPQKENPYSPEFLVATSEFFSEGDSIEEG
jgi:hypothetical protein